MTNHQIDQALIQAQYENVARLERELAEARELLGNVGREPWAGIIADAEALRALAALVTDGRMVHDVVRSTESGMYFTNCFAPHDKTTRRKVTGTGATLAAAIMDALKKAG